MKTTLSLIFLALGAADFVQAQPVISAQCPASVKMPRFSTGHYFSKDCRSVYVLPPEHGQITLTGISESALLRRCSELEGALRNLKKINGQLTEVTDGNARPEETGWNPSRPLSELGRPQVRAQQNSDENTVALLKEKARLSEEIISNFGKVHGATLGLLYSTGYGDHIKNYEELNAGSGLVFRQLPLKKTTFSFVSKDVKEGTVLSSTFPADKESLMNGSVSGQVELSLLGACPLWSKYSRRIPSTLNSQKFAALLPAKMNYEYDLQSSLEYTAEFHRGGLAEQIRKTSSKGGLFNSSTLSKLITKTRTESWFRYNGSCDEARICEAHDINVIDIKKRLMDEVISNIALVKFQQNLAPVESGTPGQTGAQTASPLLRQCANEYCQIAAGVLDVGQAIFGGTSKVDQYINSESHWASETLSTRRAYSYQGSMGFAPKEI